MKYIRTKEGIIVDTTKYKKVVERTFHDKVVAIDLNHWGQDNDKYPTWIDVKDIIKQADTIEELVDCYVIIDRDNRFPTTASKEDIEFLDYKNNKDKANFDVYGAIWVGADLKSVAKMNDKGELELL